MQGAALHGPRAWPARSLFPSQKLPPCPKRLQCLTSSWRDPSSPRKRGPGRWPSLFSLHLRASKVKARSGSGPGVRKVSPRCWQGCSAASGRPLPAQRSTWMGQSLLGQTGAFCRQVRRKTTLGPAPLPGESTLDLSLSLLHGDHQVLTEHVYCERDTVRGTRTIKQTAHKRKGGVGETRDGSLSPPRAVT